MPTVNKLFDPSKTVEPVKPFVPTQSIPPVVDSNVASTTARATEIQRDLIESKPTAPPATSDFKSQVSKLALPSFLQQSMPDVSDRELSGFIGFCSDASKRYSEQQNAGLTNGDIFLFHQGQYIKCPQLEFFIANGTSFRSVMSNTGAFPFATRDLECKRAKYKLGSYDPKLNRMTYVDVEADAQPHYICLCIVNVNGRLIPIKGDFIGTKSGGMESAIRAVESAGDINSGWEKLSEAHKVTMAFPQPFGRVFHLMRTKGEIVKSGKNAGLPYFRTVTVSGPASVTQMQLLIEHLTNGEFMEALNESYVNYQSRVKFMDDVITELNKTPAA